MYFVFSLNRLPGYVFLLSILFSFSLSTVYGGGKGKDVVGEDGCSSSKQSIVGRKPLSSDGQRLKIKLRNVSSASADGASLNWSLTRAVTPNTLVFLRTNAQTMVPLTLDSQDRTEVIPFRMGSESQGIVRANNRSIAGSVTGKISTTTKRKDEKKKTFIQYDRDRLITVGKDFPVRKKNYRSRVYYDGGHLIDHKYTAQGSHVDPRNYVPQHYFYNSPLKEYLVQGCEEFVEIPLYTPNPPYIGVKGEIDLFDEIPIGMLLIQVVNGKIKDVYFFPNNDYDYEALKKTLGIKKDFAKTMVPFFRIKKGLHCLFEPACLFHIGSSPANSSEQRNLEGRGFKRIDDLVFGISLLECDEDEEDLSKIGFSVVQKQKVDVLDFLDISESDYRKIMQNNLQQPFDVLGKFLIYYALQNGLKSEYLSTHSRLVFINLIIDFFENYHQVGKDVLDFVDDMEDEFKRALKELKNIAHTMDTEELLFLAHTYKRLTDPTIQDFTVQGHNIYADDDILLYLEKLVYVLKILDERVGAEALEGKILFSLIELHIAAQECVGYAYQVLVGEEYENVRQAREFLEEIKPQVIEWYETYSGGGEIRGVNETYDSGVNRSVSTRTSMVLIRSNIKRLGTTNGSVFGESYQ